MASPVISSPGRKRNGPSRRDSAQVSMAQASSATGVYKAWGKLGCRYVGPQNTIDVNRSEVIGQQYFAIGQAASALINRQQAKIVTAASNCAPENTHPVIALLVRLMTRLAHSALTRSILRQLCLVRITSTSLAISSSSKELLRLKAHLRFGVKSLSDAIVNPIRMACFSATQTMGQYACSFYWSQPEKKLGWSVVLCATATLLKLDH